MKVAAITLTYNRLELTKRMVESFYSKTLVDYHLFIDNGSTDGTQEWLKAYDHILLDKNYGIASAFATGVMSIEGYDYILKLDNDIETVTEGIIDKMLKFFELNGNKFVISPTDLLLDPAFAPHSFGKLTLNGYQVEFTTHTGGAFQMIPNDACLKLCQEYRSLAKGDYAIGKYFTRIGYRPTYLRDLEMKHIGINQSIKDYKM